MALVEILDIQLAAPDPERLRGFALDVPQPGARTDVYNLEIAGWVVGQRAPAIAIEVRSGDGVLRRVPLEYPRPDVDEAFPDAPMTGPCGFRTWVGVLGLEPGGELQVRAIFEDESRMWLAAIRCRHEPLRSGFEPTLQPLMLTSLGRTGSTWMMRLLSEHPEIVAHRWFPYELRTARYWIHMLKVLSEPQDPYQSAEANSFQSNKSWVGHNPFYPESMSATAGLAEWFGRTYVEELAAFCQRSAEECYRRIAARQGQTAAAYFAEKHRPDYLPGLVWELYPSAKEVFMVRDFRDVVSSMLAFNARHGRIVLGDPQARSHEEFARFFRDRAVSRLSESWSKRQDRAHLIRYEDLVRQPGETLRDVLDYLGLDHDDATIEGILARAGANNLDMQQHVTSGDVEASIGRWQRSLDPALQEACREIFGEALEKFGYEV